MAEPKTFLTRAEPEDAKIIFQLLRANAANLTLPIEGMSLATFQEIFDSSMYFFWRTPVDTLALVNLSAIDPMARKAEFGVLSLVRRQGHATAAWQALCALAFRSMGLHRLYCIVNSDNEPCLALVRNRGLRKEGKHI